MASKGAPPALPGVPAPPSKPALLRQSSSVVNYVSETAARMFDRADPLIKARQDMAIHATMFAAVVWAIQAYGHKLAV